MIFKGEFQGVVAEQNLIELYRILTNPVAMRGNPLSPSQTNSLIQNIYLVGPFEVMYPTQEAIQKALELAVSRNVTSAKIFDLRLASIALAAQISYLVTYNITDFEGIDGLIPRLPQEVTLQ
jgi:hypothetical protein